MSHLEKPHPTLLTWAAIAGLASMLIALGAWLYPAPLQGSRRPEPPEDRTSNPDSGTPIRSVGQSKGTPVVNEGRPKASAPPRSIEFVKKDDKDWIQPRTRFVKKSEIDSGIQICTSPNDGRFCYTSRDISLHRYLSGTFTVAITPLDNKNVLYWLIPGAKSSDEFVVNNRQAPKNFKLARAGETAFYTYDISAAKAKNYCLLVQGDEGTGAECRFKYDIFVEDAEIAN